MSSLARCSCGWSKRCPSVASASVAAVLHLMVDGHWDSARAEAQRRNEGFSQMYGELLRTRQDYDHARSMPVTRVAVQERYL